MGTSSSRKRIRAAAVTALTVVLLCGTTSTVSSAEPSTDAAVAHVWSNEFAHCTQVVNPTLSGHDWRRTKVEMPTCYRTAAEATAAAFGRPDLAGASDSDIAAFQSEQATTSNTAATQAAAGSQLVLSVVWKDADISGGSNAFMTSGTNNPCTVNGTNYKVGVMPAGWDNVVSSIRAIASTGCLHQRYWDGTYQTYSYAFFNPTATSAQTYYNIGLWNDRISSIDWYR